MANEAQLTAGLQFAKGNIAAKNLAVAGVNVNVAGSAYIDNVQAVGFAAREALLLGDVGTPGLCWMKNLDPTNFVDVFPDSATSVACLRLKPGEGAVFRFATATPYVKADTAAVALQYFLLSD